MKSPFDNRASGLSDPKRDIAPVTPNDGTDLTKVAHALYIETGGTLVFITEAEETRTVLVADFSIMPVGARRIMATGTTASGIHMLVD